MIHAARLVGVLLTILSLAQLDSVIGQTENGHAKLVNSAGQDTMWYGYKPNIVSLHGVLRIEEAFGPPGYGEHPESDRREKYYVILLDKPINVKADSNSVSNIDSIREVKKIQLFLKYGMQFMDKVNHHVVATGMLHEQVWSHDRTEVVLEVDSLTLSKIDRKRKM